MGIARANPVAPQNESELVQLHFDGRSNRTILENHLVRAEIDGGGQIARFVDKRYSDREVLTGRGNVFTIYDDIPLFWDAWDLEVSSYP